MEERMAEWKSYTQCELQLTRGLICYPKFKWQKVWRPVARFNEAHRMREPCVDILSEYHATRVGIFAGKTSFAICWFKPVLTGSGWHFQKHCLKHIWVPMTQELNHELIWINIFRSHSCIMSWIETVHGKHPWVMIWIDPFTRETTWVISWIKHYLNRIRNNVN